MCSWLYLCAHASLKTSNEAWSTITNQPEYSSHHVRAEISPLTHEHRHFQGKQSQRGGEKGQIWGDQTTVYFGSTICPHGRSFLVVQHWLQWGEEGLALGQLPWVKSYIALCWISDRMKKTNFYTVYTDTPSKYFSDISCMGRFLKDLLLVKTNLPTSQTTKSQLHRQAVILAIFSVK